MTSPRLSDEEFEREHDYLANMGGTRRMLDEARRARESEKAALDVLPDIADLHRKVHDFDQLGPAYDHRFEEVEAALSAIYDKLQKAGRR